MALSVIQLRIASSFRPFLVMKTSPHLSIRSISRLASTRVVRSGAKAWVERGFGGQGKGRQPLCPCFLAVEEGIHGGAPNGASPSSTIAMTHICSVLFVTLYSRSSHLQMSNTVAVRSLAVAGAISSQIAVRAFKSFTPSGTPQPVTASNPDPAL